MYGKILPKIFLKSVNKNNENHWDVLIWMPKLE